MLVSGLLTLINHTLSDAANTVIAEATKIAAINEAIDMIVSVKPESNVVTGAIATVAGIQQTMPAGSIRLRGIYCNTDAAGAVHGRAVKQQHLEQLNAIDNDWPTETAASTIREYIYDPDKDAGTWLSMPPQSGAGYVLASYSKQPDALTATSDTFPLSDNYTAPAVELALYRLFDRDDVGTENHARGIQHYRKGMELLGIQSTIDDKADQELRQP